MRYAEDMNYWQTTVHPANSQGEIIELLENFGVANTIIIQGNVGSKHAWLIRFQWEDRSYRFVFTPLECRAPEKTYSFGGKRRTAGEQAKYQMGRIAVGFVKAVLTAAEAQPAALFGFLELPAASKGVFPMTTADLDVSGLVGLLPMPDINVLQLNEKNG